MDFDPEEVVTIELDSEGWSAPYARDVTRRQLGELLLQLDDMAAATAAAQEEQRGSTRAPTSGTG
ncbi:hypothetical protein ACFO9E_27450 [Streptomyces maoxianensis]|uniref:Uncharacterized protein n=1 Tax=Streptomyces maoxianensis TaxID=1459942 RepID=A0ABV9GEN1_9ACTN